MPEYQTVVDALVKFATQLLLIALPIVTAVVARWVYAQAQVLLARAKEQNSYLVEVGAKLAVEMAEQMHLANLIEDRKSEAVSFLTDWLHSRGLNLPVAEIEATVEAAVYREINLPRDWHDVADSLNTPTPPKQG